MGQTFIHSSIHTIDIYRALNYAQALCWVLAKHQGFPHSIHPQSAEPESHLADKGQMSRAWKKRAGSPG